MTTNDPKFRRRGKAKRELTVIETFSDEYPDDEAFWEAHPTALKLFGRMLARYALNRRREQQEVQPTETSG